MKVPVQARAVIRDGLSRRNLPSASRRVVPGIQPHGGITVHCPPSNHPNLTVACVCPDIGVGICCPGSCTGCGVNDTGACVCEYELKP